MLGKLNRVVVDSGDGPGRSTNEDDDNRYTSEEQRNIGSGTSSGEREREKYKETGIRRKMERQTRRERYDMEKKITYDDTLTEWKTKSAKIAFIYDYVGDSYRKSLNRTSIISFILTSCISLLALSNLGLSDSDYKTVSIVLKGVNALLAVSAAITTGLPRILNWNLTLEACQKYLDSVENLMASIVSEQSLPMKFRSDPEQFILANKEKFYTILDSAPNIPHDEYVAALSAYDQQKMRLRHDLIKFTVSESQLDSELYPRYQKESLEEPGVGQ